MNEDRLDSLTFFWMAFRRFLLLFRLFIDLFFDDVLALVLYRGVDGVIVDCAMTRFWSSLFFMRSFSSFVFLMARLSFCFGVISGRNFL